MVPEARSQGHLKVGRQQLVGGVRRLAWVCDKRVAVPVPHLTGQATFPLRPQLFLPRETDSLEPALQAFGQNKHAALPSHPQKCPTP